MHLLNTFDPHEPEAPCLVTYLQRFAFFDEDKIGNRFLVDGHQGQDEAIPRTGGR